MKKIKKIVLTGGPCGGKTSAISRIVQELSQMGYSVLVIPETATELILNGIRPFGNCLNSYEFQKIVLDKQLHKEKIYDSVAEILNNDNIVIIFDRGIMDSKSYVSKEEFNKLFEEFKLNEAQVLSKYDTIIHMVTAANGAEPFYILENNSARKESAEEARALDKRTLDNWVGHNDVRIIDNSTDFDTKLNIVMENIYSIIGHPIYPQFQKKYFVFRPDIDILKRTIKFTLSNITQTYIENLSKGIERKVRKVCINGNFSYYLTEKIKLKNSVSKKITTISKDEYEFLLLDANREGKNLRTICKERIFFAYDDQYFYLDLFDFSTEYAILEINYLKGHEKIKIPSFINVIKDVTDDERFMNYNLAIKKIIYIKNKQRAGFKIKLAL